MTSFHIAQALLVTLICARGFCQPKTVRFSFSCLQTPLLPCPEHCKQQMGLQRVPPSSSARAISELLPLLPAQSSGAPAPKWCQQPPARALPKPGASSRHGLKHRIQLCPMQAAAPRENESEKLHCCAFPPSWDPARSHLRLIFLFTARGTLLVTAEGSAQSCTPRSLLLRGARETLLCPRGGLAAHGAACLTHLRDFKVQLVVRQEGP